MLQVSKTLEGGKIQKLLEPSQTKINSSSSTKRKTNGAYDYSLDPTQVQGISKVMWMPILVNQLVTIMPNNTKSNKKYFGNKFWKWNYITYNLDDIYEVEHKLN